MVGNSQSKFTVKIHTFIPRKILGIPRNSKSHFARADGSLVLTALARHLSSRMGVPITDLSELGSYTCSTHCKYKQWAFQGREAC